MQPSIRTKTEVWGLAPPYGLATHCLGHCNMSVAQGIKGPCGFDVIPSFLPARRILGSKQSAVGSGRKYLSTAYRPLGCAVFRDTCNTNQGLRSLPQLRERLTARADDNHAAPVLGVPCGKARVSSGGLREFQALVRFFVHCRIKPHVPPLVRVPVYSFEF